MNLTPLARPLFRRRADRALRASLSPVESQIRQLRWILYRAADTEYGREHDFQSILALEDPREAYARLLEPQGYEHFRPYVMRMFRGEKDILWPGFCHDYAQSSGTSGGRSKYIPITQAALHLNHYAGAADSVALYLRAYPDSRMFAGKGFILGGSFESQLKSENPKVHVGDLSATLINSINPLANHFRVPDKETALMADWSEKLDRLAEKAISESVTNISGVPSWFLKVLQRCLEITGKNSLREIWPDLEVFFHGGISFEPYRATYEVLDPNLRYWENYNASEGFFGCTKDPGGPLLLLTDVTVYYEFLPLGEEEPVKIENLKPGETYELLITAPNGLFRYRIGDTITVTGTDPVTFHIAGRTKSFINAFGEELMEENAERAIAEAQRATGSKIVDYTAGPQYPVKGRKGRHRWLIEWDTPPADMEVFARELDKSLRALNSDYDAKRNGDIFLDMPLIETAPAGVFDAYLAQTGSRKLGGQRKVPRLSNTPELLERIKTSLSPQHP